MSSSSPSIFPESGERAPAFCHFFILPLCFISSLLFPVVAGESGGSPSLCKAQWSMVKVETRCRCARLKFFIMLLCLYLSSPLLFCSCYSRVCSWCA
ncbi:uncharacterized protein LOC129318895 isoform X3 [Prosopis cineraria]|uniref:uncharacterized protein LOC129318895 isoform X3 n=1 Tax=Prosopis cineraria TaxID=364024 RepID=UPI00240EFF8D|nr:uncharacterized protein LOC129318895 isoform X3 [Prosopis cineraria]